MDQETQKIMQRSQLNRNKQKLILMFGDAEGARIHQNVLAKYQELLETRKIPPTKLLDNHLVYMILPLLAFYEGLLNSGMEKTQAQEIIAQLYDEFLRKTAKSFAQMGRIPFFYSLFRNFIKQNNKRMFPPEGWNIHWIENSKSQIAFDVSRCFIYDILKGYGQEELTKVLCKSDDYIYENISPCIKWERTKIIGGGDAICDFRFIRVAKNMKR